MLSGCLYAPSSHPSGIPCCACCSFELRGWRDRLQWQICRGGRGGVMWFRGVLTENGLRVTVPSDCDQNDWSSRSEKIK